LDWVLCARSHDRQNCFLNWSASQTCTVEAACASGLDSRPGVSCQWQVCVSGDSFLDILRVTSPCLLCSRCAHMPREGRAWTIIPCQTSGRGRWRWPVHASPRRSSAVQQIKGYHAGRLRRHLLCSWRAVQTCSRSIRLQHFSAGVLHRQRRARVSASLLCLLLHGRLVTCL